jgi:hypothetical protein
VLLEIWLFTFNFSLSRVHLTICGFLVKSRATTRDRPYQTLFFRRGWPCVCPPLTALTTHSKILPDVVRCTPRVQTNPCSTPNSGFTNAYFGIVSILEHKRIRARRYAWRTSCVLRCFNPRAQTNPCSTWGFEHVAYALLVSILEHKRIRARQVALRQGGLDALTFQSSSTNESVLDKGVRQCRLACRFRPAFREPFANNNPIFLEFLFDCQDSRAVAQFCIPRTSRSFGQH